MAHEKELRGLSSWLAVVVVVLVGAAAVWMMAGFDTVADGLDWIKMAGIAVLIVAGLCLAGLTVVNPIRRSGFWCAHAKRQLSACRQGVDPHR